MRRRLQNPQPENEKPPRMEPLAEGIAEGRKPPGFYSKMDDDDFVAFVRGRMAGLGISGRCELYTNDNGIYQAFLKRARKNPGIADRIGFARKHWDWESIGDEELAAYARDFVGKMGIRGRKGLKDADEGLYNALRTREGRVPGLFARAGIGGKRKRAGYWDSMDDGELVEYARDFIGKKGIGSIGGLAQADKGLYSALRRREKKNPGLMAAIGVGKRYKERRHWNSMGDHEFVGYVKGLLADSGIRGRGQLAEADMGVYQEFRRRERERPQAMAAVFKEAESKKHANAVAGVLDALGSFVEESE